MFIFCLYYILFFYSDSGGDPPQSALFGFGAITTAIACEFYNSERPNQCLPSIQRKGTHEERRAPFFLLTVAASRLAVMIIFSLRYITVKDITKGTKDASLIRLFNYLTFVAGLGVFLGLVMVATNATGHLRRDGTWVRSMSLEKDAVLRGIQSEYLNVYPFVRSAWLGKD